MVRYMLLTIDFKFLYILYPFMMSIIYIYINLSVGLS
jgi:hypothetical protein